MTQNDKRTLVNIFVIAFIANTMFGSPLTTASKQIFKLYVVKNDCTSNSGLSSHILPVNSYLLLFFTAFPNFEFDA